ncbi:MAG: GTP-binding protein [Devosia sp.]
MTFTPVPITIIGGFLGSGKTSLLNHILSKSSNERIAVLVNDFGDINIDAKLIVSIEGETISLANGCVCCTIRDDLLEEVINVLGREERPEHIVIETSGVSKPVAVVETFANPSVQTLVDVQNLITVLDADLVVDDEASFGTLAFDQIVTADLVVINKTDLVSPPQLSALKAKVQGMVPRARLWDTTFGVVPLDLIFGAPSLRAQPGGAEPHGHHNGHAHGDHETTFEAWSFRSQKAWSFNALQRAMEHLPLGIYRAKGLVKLDLPTDDYGIMQMTGRRAWLRLCEPADGEDGVGETELVFIGTKGATTDDALHDHFQKAWVDANDPAIHSYTVSDLRAFTVLFS